MYGLNTDSSKVGFYQHNKQYCRACDRAHVVRGVMWRVVCVMQGELWGAGGGQ